jgi:hypothetical protein|nr:MAG TPA: hypothetical protein [Caudoviricetes sp.]
MITVKTILEGNMENLTNDEKEIVNDAINQIDNIVEFKKIQSAIPEIKENMQNSILSKIPLELFNRLLNVTLRMSKFMLQFEDGTSKTYRDIYKEIEQNEGASETFEDIVFETVCLKKRLTEALTEVMTGKAAC